jgi:hypothetical protein
MIGHLIWLAEGDLFSWAVLALIVGIPVFALVLYLKHPHWYQEDQNRKYVKVTTTIYIVGILVLILELLGVI